jgi:DNA-binding LacI/PurR family transcriptional regulator
VDELLGYRCAAVIVIGSGLPAAELRELADRVTVPMVALGASQRSPAFDVVRSADDIGIALAVEHLVGLGPAGRAIPGAMRGGSLLPIGN